MSLYTLTVDLLAKTGSFERDMGKAARIADRDAQKIEAAATRVGLAVGAAVGAAVTGITYMVQRQISAMDSTSKMANQIGVATEQLTSMRYAAQQMANVSEGQFDMAMRRMTRRITEAAAGGGPAAAMLKQIGLNARELANQSPDEQFRRVADAIKAVGDQGTRLRAVMALMDTEGMPLVNMLTAGSGAIRELQQEAERLGLTLDAKTAKAAEEFSSTMTRVRAAATGFAMQVGGELVPTLNDVAESLYRVQGNGELASRVASGIGTAFETGAAGVKFFADNMVLIMSALGSFTGLRTMQAINRRIAAVLIGIKADQDAAAASLASARASVAKAEAAVVEAGATLRAASTNRQRILAERALTAAVNDHTLARQRLTAAETAAARASAGLITRAGRATLALFGGVGGLAIMLASTAASWLYFRDNTREAESALANWNGTAEDALKTFRELNREQRAGAMLALSNEIEEAANQIQAAIGRIGAEAVRELPFEQVQAFNRKARDLFQQFEAGAISLDELSGGVADYARSMIEGRNVSDGLRESVTRQADAVATTGRRIEEKRGILREFERVQRDAEAATDGMTAAMRRQQEQADLSSNSVGQFITNLRDQIQKGEQELAKLRGGAQGELDFLFHAAVSADGNVDPFQLLDAMEEMQRRRAQLAQIEAAQAAARSRTSGARDAERAAERQAESIARYNREAEMAAATLAGPLQAAEVAHRHRLADLDAELKKGNISQAAYNTLKAEAVDQLERTTRALQEQQRAPADLLGAMREEFELLGMIGPEREIYRRGLQAEREMRDAINRANEAGAGINDEVGESLIRQARAWGVASVEIEEAARAAEAWQWTVMGSVEGVADLFTDVFSGQIKSTRDFFTELKDIWKRGWWDIVRMSMQQSFVNPIQRALAGMMSGQGFAGAGMGPGAMAQGLAGTVLLGGAGGGATAIGAGTATGTLYPGWGYGGPGVAGVAGPGGMGGGGGFGMGGMPSMNMLTGEFAGGMPYASAALGLYGLYYGATQRGNNALVSGVAGLSYGALGIAAGGAIAGGLGAIGTGVGLAGAGAGAAAGSTAAMGSAASAVGGAAWIPVVGWVLAALAAIDLVSGGRLFGTKFKPQSITQDIGIDEFGGIASASVHETRKRSLFRGTARRDRDIATTPEQRQAAQDLYDAIEGVARSASTQLGLATVDIIGGSIRQVYNRDGELQSELSTVLGQTFEETFEEFASRLTSEQLIAAVGQIDSAASRIAQDWRHSAEVLAEGAEFFMTAASDARNGMDLWSGIGLQALTDFVEQMQMGEETLGQAYGRLAGIARDYGSLITDINTQLMGEGLNSYQQQALQVERTYRQQVKAANDYAKALGLTGARAEDLAKIEELRAVNLGKLQAQMEADNAAFLGQLALSDLSTLRDDQKLAEAMTQLRDAVGAGDTRAAQQAAQAALGFGRNLYASGRDYQSLYDQVTGQLRGMTLDPDDLDMGDLADEIEAMHEGISRALFELAARGEQTITAPIRAEQQRTNQLLGDVLEELRRQGRSADSQRLANELNGRQAVMVR